MLGDPMSTEQRGGETSDLVTFVIIALPKETDTGCIVNCEPLRSCIVSASPNRHEHSTTARTGIRAFS